MKIEELKNQYVKISDRSITCKDENGKTKGIVTNAINFLKMQPNKQFEYSGKLRASGIWGSGEANKVYIIDGKIYYLFNLKSIETYEKYFKDKPGWESETEHYNKQMKLAEEAAKIGTVIPCYIL